MAKHDFGYFAHEGLSNMFSHGFMSFAAIGITVACLLIMGTFTLVAVNANGLLKDLEQENEILAYVDDTYTEQEAKALQKKLEAIPNVTSATYISKQQATADLPPGILRSSCSRIWTRKYSGTATPSRSRTWSSRARLWRRSRIPPASPRSTPMRRSPAALSPSAMWPPWCAWR